MILDEIKQAFNTGTYRSMADKSGLSYTRVYGIRNGKPFIFDDGLVKALESLGYELTLKKKWSQMEYGPPMKVVTPRIEPRKKLDLDKQMELCKKLGMNYRDMQMADTLARVNMNA